MVNVTLSSGSNAAAPASSSKWKIMGVAALLLGAAGFAVWWFFVRKPPTTPIPPVDSRGSGWTCIQGTKGGVSTFKDCSKSDAKQGDLCKAASGILGSCSSTTAPPGISHSPTAIRSGGAQPASNLSCTATTTPSSAACSDACYEDATNFYSLWNTIDQSCVCRPKASEDIFWENCVLDSDSSTLVTCADEKLGHLNKCDVSLTSLGKYALGSLEGQIANIPVPSEEACKAEVAGRRASHDKTHSNDFAVFHATPNADGTYTCQIKTLDPGKDRLGWDCQWNCDNDPGNCESISLISPEYQTTDQQNKLTNGDVKRCQQLQKAVVHGDLAPNIRLRPRKVEADAGSPLLNSVQSCARQCATATTAPFPGSQINLPIAQPASIWDGSDCLCFDYPEESWARCASPNGNKTADMYVLTSGPVSPPRGMAITDIPDCEAKYSWDPRTMGTCTAKGFGDGITVDVNNCGASPDSRVNYGRECYQHAGSTSQFAYPYLGYQIEPDPSNPDDLSAQCICVPCLYGPDEKQEKENPRLPNDFNNYHRDAVVPPPWVKGQCVDNSDTFSAHSMPDQRPRVRCSPANHGLATLCDGSKRSDSHCNSTSDYTLECLYDTAYDEVGCDTGFGCEGKMWFNECTLQK